MTLEELQDEIGRKIIKLANTISDRDAEIARLKESLKRLADEKTVSIMIHDLRNNNAQSHHIAKEILYYLRGGGNK